MWFRSRCFPAVWFLLLIGVICCPSGRVDAISRRSAAARKALYRGKVLHGDPSNEELYSTFLKVVQDHERTLHRPEAWRVVKQTEDGVQVALQDAPDDTRCPYVRLSAIMPASAERMHHFMRSSNWGTFMRLINPFYAGIQVLKTYQCGPVEMTMLRKHTSRICGLQRRDFGLVSVMDVKRDNGTWISGAFSVISPQVPRQAGFTRAFQDSVCFYEPLSQDRCRMTIVLRTDLNDSSQDGSGGYVPMWLVVRTLGLSGSMAMKGLRKIVQQ